MFGNVRHPFWMCGLRPFFLLAGLAAPLLMLAWLAFLGLGLPMPPTAGDPFVWHAHELLFGFTLAAVAGFTLTIVPEFAGGGIVAGDHRFEVSRPAAVEAIDQRGVPESGRFDGRIVGAKETAECQQQSETEDFLGHGVISFRNLS